MSKENACWRDTLQGAENALLRKRERKRLSKFSSLKINSLLSGISRELKCSGTKGHFEASYRTGSQGIRSF